MAIVGNEGALGAGGVKIGELVDWKKIIIFGVLAAILAGIAWYSWQVFDDQRSYSLYTNEKEGLSMKYPKGWKLVQYPDTGAIVAMIKPKANAFVTFQANWNISATTLEKPFTLDQFARAAGNQVRFMFREVQTTVTPIMLSGHEGRQMVYLSPHPEGMVLISYVFLYRGVAYNIMYMDARDSYVDPIKRRAITHVIGSLKVKF